jgi:hypothetical protein
VEQVDVARTPSSASVWADRALGLAVAALFSAGLVLRILEPPARLRTLQFVLLGVAAVLALALVLLRRSHRRRLESEQGPSAESLRG